MVQLSIKKFLQERTFLPVILTHRLSGGTKQSETGRLANSRDNQIARGKGKNISNTNQGYLALSVPNTSTIARPGYSKITERQDCYLISHLIMMIEDIKRTIIIHSKKY